MKQYIGCDAHARYSVFVSVDETGKIGPPVRVEHGSRDLRDYLGKLEKRLRWPSKPAAAGIGSWMSWRPPGWMRVWSGQLSSCAKWPF